MKKMFKTLCGLFLFPLVLNSPTFAASKTGVVDAYAIYENSGTKYFFFSIANYYALGEDPGTCNTTSRFVFDDTKGIFELLSSSLMSAHHSASTVNVNYAKNCTVSTTSYDVNYACVGGLTPC